MTDQTEVSKGYERFSGYERVGPPVPGDGPIIATFTHKGDLYAIRENGGYLRGWRAANGSWELALI